MKSLIVTLFILFLSSKEIFPIIGEYWFLIDDNNLGNYKVVATRVDVMQPLFGRVNGINYMEVDSNLYNEVTSDEDVLTGSIPEPFDVRRGFDYLTDPGLWPAIGEGYLEFSIYQVLDPAHSELLFTFKLNNLHAVSSPDLTFEYRISQPGVLTAKGGSPQVQTQIYNNDSKQIWNLLGEQ